MKSSDTNLVPDSGISNEQDPAAVPESERYRCIPQGGYCYHAAEDALRGMRLLYPRKRKLRRFRYRARPGGRPLTRACPYWEKKTSRTGFCSYLGQSDREIKGGRLIDMIKACGIHPGYDSYFREFMRKNGGRRSFGDAKVPGFIFNRLAGTIFDYRRDTFLSRELIPGIAAELGKQGITCLNLEPLAMQMMRFLAEKRRLVPATFDFYEEDLTRHIWSVMMRCADTDMEEIGTITRGMIEILLSEGDEISTDSLVEKAAGLESLKRFHPGTIEELVMSVFGFFERNGVLR